MEDDYVTVLKILDCIGTRFSTSLAHAVGTSVIGLSHSLRIVLALVTTQIMLVVPLGKWKMILELLHGTYKPVSYTHLDVYKRQDHTHLTLETIMLLSLHK